MSLTRTKSKQKVKQTRTPITWKEIKRQKVLLFWAGVMMIYGVIFYYLPLAGWSNTECFDGSICNCIW